MKMQQFGRLLTLLEVFQYKKIMGIIRFKNAEKQRIKFGNGFAEFIRGITSVKTVDISYSNATGQNIAANYILYTTLLPSEDGYIQVKSTNNVTLIGSGLLNLTITHKVSLTQLDQDVNFSYDNSVINFDFSYNSTPEGSDIFIDVPNRALYIFLITDFTNNYSDFDQDPMSSVSIFGDVSGYEIQGVTYNEGDWIPRSIIESNDFKYLTLDQNGLYEKENTYKVMDIKGNISTQSPLPNLKLRITGLTCITPILESVTHLIDRQFALVWNYNGADYSGDITTVISVLVSNDNINFQLVPGLVGYPGTSKTVDMKDELWEIFYFKVQLINRNCNEISNTIMQTI